MHLFKLLNFNFLLGLGLTAIAIYLLNHATDISEANDIDKQSVQGSIVIAALVLFGFFAIFRTIVGAIFKTTSYLAIAVYIYFQTDKIEDETMVVIIDIALVMMIVFALYALFSTLYEKKS